MSLNTHIGTRVGILGLPAGYAPAASSDTSGIRHADPESVTADGARAAS
jgi:hypothetical protein